MTNKKKKTQIKITVQRYPRRQREKAEPRQEGDFNEENERGGEIRRLLLMKEEIKK